jgi:transcriptional regulator
MYVNPLHELTDREVLFSLMASRPLGAWVCHGREGLIANHVPFLLDRGRGPLGTLIGHVARANVVWRELDSSTPSVVMFHGPQAYITPGWYPSKAEHGQVVPTWNYVVAHAHGVARAIEDLDWLLDMLNRLTDVHEARRSVPWSVGDAPRSYIDKMMHAIVGIEIPIERLEGKLKASQDEAIQDRHGTVRGLQQEAGDEPEAMAALVSEAIAADEARRY